MNSLLPQDLFRIKVRGWTRVNVCVELIAPSMMRSHPGTSHSSKLLLPNLIWRQNILPVAYIHGLKQTEYSVFLFTFVLHTPLWFNVLLMVDS